MADVYYFSRSLCNFAARPVFLLKINLFSTLLSTCASQINHSVFKRECYCLNNNISEILLKSRTACIVIVSSLA